MALNGPNPETGMSQGIWVIGPLDTIPSSLEPKAPMGALPVQPEPTSAPAVVKFDVGANDVGKVLSKLVEMAPGAFVFK